MEHGKIIKKIITEVLKKDLASGKVAKVNSFTYQYPLYQSNDSQG
ncbi:hypothetical protein ODR81_02535 [Escherichia coli]